MTPPSSMRRSLAAGFLAGTLTGYALLAAGLLFPATRLLSNGLLPLDRYLGTTGWILASAATYGLLVGLLGALAGLSYHPIARNHPHRLFDILLSLGLATVVLAQLTVTGQIYGLSGLALDDPARFALGLRHGLLALASGAALFALLTLYSRWRPPNPSAGLTRPAIVLFVLQLILCLADATLHAPGNATPGEPQQVVVVGLDGMTFRILTPLLEAGELPTFARLIDEGAWGTFMTYGTASSPQVWTSLATGHRVRDHGIDDFVHAERGGYRAVPLKSTDRRTRAIWNLLSTAERRVAVVNWLITSPPEAVNGVMVPDLETRDQLRTHPPEVGSELEATLDPLKPPRPNHFHHYRLRIDRVFDTAQNLLKRESVDFLALMNASTDAAQHRLWKEYEPEAFEADLWQLDQIPEAKRERRGRVLPKIYRHLDRRLQRLLKDLGPDTLLIVLSDHGQQPAHAPRVTFRLARLLVRLGWAEPAKNPKKRQPLKLERSRAYPLVETPWAPTPRINLNVVDREPKGLVPPNRVERERRALVRDLEALRLDDGSPLFGPIESGQDVDLRTPLAAGIRDPRLADRRLLFPDGTSEPLADYLNIDTTLSGDHDHQGVIFLHGPGVRPGFHGQRIATTAVQDLIWHLTDKVDAIDPLLPPLRRLGLLDRATTLDLTPTVLHAFGLPVGEDMEGRALTDLLHTGRPVETLETWELGNQGPTADPTEDSEDDDEALLERLRSLGYVN